MIQNIQINYTYFALIVKNGLKLIMKMKNKLHCLGMIILFIKISKLIKKFRIYTYGGINSSTGVLKDFWVFDIE